MGKKDIDIKGIIGEDVNIESIKEQIGENNTNDLVFHIDSPGGYVDSGIEIYEFIKEQDVHTTTIAENQADSIASIILVGGDKRVVEDNTEVMIHNPYLEYINGNANELEQTAIKLREIENNLKDIYLEQTQIDEKLLSELMDNETILSDENLKGFGFVNMEKESVNTTKLKAVAYVKKDENNINDIMENNNKKLYSKIIDFFKNLTVEEDEIKNNIVNMIQLTDVNGGILQFPDLEEGTTPSVEDIAMVITEDEEGNVVETKAEGEYILPENEVYIFDDGLLKEIKPLEEEVVEEVVVDENDIKSLFPKEDGEVNIKVIMKDGEVSFEVIEDVVEDVVDSTEEIKTEMLNLKKELDDKIEAMNAKITTDFVPGAIVNRIEEDTTTKKRVFKFKK